MKYDYQTVSRTILGDLHTPVSTYLKVRDIFPQSALMESSDYHAVKQPLIHRTLPGSKRQYRPQCCRVLPARRHT